MWNMNSGYSGYSMSNRAVDAYEDGEMPLSKWTKKMIISEVVEHEHFTEEGLKKYPKNVLAEYFLFESSWHHTSSYCNKTYFYSIDEDIAKEGSIEELEEIKKRHAPERKPKKDFKKLEARKAYIIFLEWGGTRTHPKATEVNAYAVIIGNWAYLESGKKKSVCSNGFRVIKYLDRAPRGTANIFKRILKNLPNAIKKKI